MWSLFIFVFIIFLLILILLGIDCFKYLTSGTVGRDLGRNIGGFVVEVEKGIDDVSKE